MTDAATLSGTRAISHEEVFPHRPETVWHTLTTGELIGHWLMEPKGFEPVVGNEFTFQTTPAGKWNGTIHCRVLEVVPQRLFAFSWKGGDDANAGYGSLLDTIVAWTLTPEGAGTRLNLVHSGFAQPRNDSAFNNMNEGWKKVLGNIGNIAAGQSA